MSLSKPGLHSKTLSPTNKNKQNLEIKEIAFAVNNKDP
jgi:hypothetical protein